MVALMVTGNVCMNEEGDRASPISSSRSRPSNMAVFLAGWCHVVRLGEHFLGGEKAFAWRLRRLEAAGWLTFQSQRLRLAEGHHPPSSAMHVESEPA